jgi:hypothetical protein
VTIGVTIGEGIVNWITGGTAGELVLIWVGSTYGVGGFAMIEARDNGESVSIAGGAGLEMGWTVGR